MFSSNLAGLRTSRASVASSSSNLQTHVSTQFCERRAFRESRSRPWQEQIVRQANPPRSVPVPPAFSRPVNPSRLPRPSPQPPVRFAKIYERSIAPCPPTLSSPALSRLPAKPSVIDVSRLPRRAPSRFQPRAIDPTPACPNAEPAKKGPKLRIRRDPSAKRRFPSVIGDFPQPTLCTAKLPEEVTVEPTSPESLPTQVREVVEWLRLLPESRGVGQHGLIRVAKTELANGNWNPNYEGGKKPVPQQVKSLEDSRSTLEISTVYLDYDFYSYLKPSGEVKVRRTRRKAPPVPPPLPRRMVPVTPANPRPKPRPPPADTRPSSIRDRLDKLETLASEINAMLEGPLASRKPAGSQSSDGTVTAKLGTAGHAKLTFRDEDASASHFLKGTGGSSQAHIDITSYAVPPAKTFRRADPEDDISPAEEVPRRRSLRRRSSGAPVKSEPQLKGILKKVSLDSFCRHFDAPRRAAAPKKRSVKSVKWADEAGGKLRRTRRYKVFDQDKLQYGVDLEYLIGRPISWSSNPSVVVSHNPCPVKRLDDFPRTLMPLAVARYQAVQRYNVREVEFSWHKQQFYGTSQWLVNLHTASQQVSVPTRQDIFTRVELEIEFAVIRGYGRGWWNAIGNGPRETYTGSAESTVRFHVDADTTFLD